MDKLAAAIYRKSTGKQTESIEQQRAYIREFAEREGYRIGEEIVEDAISGGNTKKRGAFLAMIDRATKGEVHWKYLLAYDSARFSRSDSVEANHYLYLLRTAGIQVIFVAQPIPNDRYGDIVRAVQQVQNNDYLWKASEQTLRGVVSRARIGVFCGGRPPFGFDFLIIDSKTRKPLRKVRPVRETVYERLPDGSKKCIVTSLHEIHNLDGKLEKLLEGTLEGPPSIKSETEYTTLIPGHPDNIATIRFIFDRCIKGFGIRRIAKELEGRKIPSPRRVHWEVHQILSILNNPAYKGCATWNRRTMKGYHKVSREADGAWKLVQKNNTERYKLSANGRESWFCVEGAFEPIISPDAWELAQRKIRERSCITRGNGRTRRGRPLPGRGAYLLSGKIVCHRCGRHYHGCCNRKGRSDYEGKRPLNTYYICGGYSIGGNELCRRNSIQTAVLDNAILQRCGDRLRQYAVQRDIVRDLEQVIHSDILGLSAESVNRTKEQLQKVDIGISNLQRDLPWLGDEERRVVYGRIRELQSEKEELESHIEENERRSDRMDIGALARVLSEYVERFQEVIAQGSLEERKEIINPILKGITIYPEENLADVAWYKIPAVEAGTGGVKRCGSGGWI